MTDIFQFTRGQMRFFALDQPSKSLFHSYPLWVRWCSITTFVASLGFLCISSFIHNNLVPLDTGFLPSLLVVLFFVALLNIYSLLHLRKQYGQTDKAFREADCEFSSIFQNVLDGILIVNNEGDCLDANPAAAAILRFARNKLVGQNINSFLLDYDAFTQGWKSFLKSNSQRGRVRLIAGDGTMLFVDFTAAVNYLPGRHVFIICDVTERTCAEESLKESEERFRHMADNIQEIFWMMDADTKDVIYVNQAYTTITGHSIESLYKSPSSYRELIHPQDRIRVLSKLQEVVDSGCFDEEFQFIHARGGVRWIWVKAFPVQEYGLTRWLVGTAHDISSRKQAERQI